MRFALALFMVAAPALAQPPAQPSGQPPGKFFDATDSNRDGVLSAAEWQAAGRNPVGFRMMDMNGDGLVTRAEGRAAMQKMREQAAPAGR